MKLKMAFIDIGLAPFCWKLGDMRLGRLVGNDRFEAIWEPGLYTMYALGPFRISWCRFWKLN